MRVDEFDFELPQELIAQEPVNPRDSSKLLEVKANGRYYDHPFSYFPSLLRAGDLLVFNNTKVIPARLRGKRDGASVEITLHKKIEETIWRAFAKPAKKLKPGDIFTVSDDFHAEVSRKNSEGEVELKFNVGREEFSSHLNKHGIMPLPPYIRRKTGERPQDREDYQTIFASNPGAVAAPTAGLHFTDEMLKVVDEKNIGKCFVTLHVGAGTFLPVKTYNIKSHKMHSEWYEVSENTAEQINTARKNGGRIICVGTTSLRTLESASDRNGKIVDGSRDTDIFIYPGYKFKVADMLLTNFHLPRSTLFMLVSAFAGTRTMHEAYEHAINSGYRFFSYGDACLIHHSSVI